MATTLDIVVVLMTTQRTQSSGVGVGSLANLSQSFPLYHVVVLELLRVHAVDSRMNGHVAATVCQLQDGPEVNGIVGNGPVGRKPRPSVYLPGEITRELPVVCAARTAGEWTSYNRKSRQFESKQSPQGLALFFQQYCSRC